MDLIKFIEEQQLTGFPIGLGGCRATSSFFESCEYNITIFDDKLADDKIISYDKILFKIHHGSLRETRSSVLVQYDGMKIIHDESWELRMLLSKIKEKRIIYYMDHAKNCLIDSLFCCQKCTEGIKISNVFSPCWQLCASYFLFEAICAINLCRSSPSHMLESMRKFEKNTINNQLSIVTENIGIERATTSLLDRMLKSTIGFSDLVENNDNSKIINKKYDFFIKNSMLADCYFYLGYTNKKNFIQIKDTLEKRPELIHILKIAFDIETDSNLLLQQAELVRKSSISILDTISSA